MRKLTLEHCCIVAKSNGGKCLSKNYQSARTKMLWQCENGHKWQADYDHVKRGQWCPKCGIKSAADAKRDNIDTFHKLAKQRGGECLSNTYENSNSSLKFRCENGHTWSAIAESIKAGTWCGKCYGLGFSSKENIKICRDLAKNKGGKCLSKEYKNSSAKLQWQCNADHTWWAVPKSIKQGNWCPQCARVLTANAQRGNLAEYIEIARSRGGECLSTEYKTNDTKLQWKCRDGHTWWAIPSSVKTGTWCPQCTVFVGEEICRFYFEHIFKKNFPKSRPDFLISKEFQRLELDGYNEELGLAFEHQGIQHYKAFAYFGGNKGLKELRRRDKIKRRLCAENNVTLIEIEDVVHMVGLENINRYIKNKLEHHNLELPFDPPPYEQVSIKTRQAKLDKSFAIANSRGGKCLSHVYSGGRSKLQWECSSKHTWFATFGEVKGTANRPGTWCPTCAKLNSGSSQRGNIEAFHRIAKERGGRCLSAEYKNSQSKLNWKCRYGHTWEAIPASIKMGTWCPKCARKRKSNSK